MPGTTGAPERPPRPALARRAAAAYAPTQRAPPERAQPEHAQPERTPQFFQPEPARADRPHGRARSARDFRAGPHHVLRVGVTTKTKAHWACERRSGPRRVHGPTARQQRQQREPTHERDHGVRQPVVLAQARVRVASGAQVACEARPRQRSVAQQVDGAGARLQAAASVVVDARVTRTASLIAASLLTSPVPRTPACGGRSHRSPLCLTSFFRRGPRVTRSRSGTRRRATPGARRS